MSRRRTHCPNGWPLYRIGELPENLATVTMLKRMRRRPAEGQEPAGTLLYRGNEYAPLYEVAAAVELPALTGKAAARYTAHRTCARCAEVNSEQPFREYEDGRRLCPRCTTAERFAKHRPSWLALRIQATAWARNVLADPDTVLLAAHRHTFSYPVELHAVTLAGEVLVDAVVWPKSPAWKLARTPGAIDAADVVPTLTPLVGRRAIHHIDGGRHGWASHITPLGEVARSSGVWFEDDLAGPAVRQVSDDAYQQRWIDWWSRPHDTGLPDAGRRGIAHVPVATDLMRESPALTRELAAVMRDGLVVMAADDHPDGPPRCPVLPPTGLEPCGAAAGPTGRCSDHEQTAGEAP